MPEGQRLRIELNTDPHVAEVPKGDGIVELRFIPEAYTDELLAAYGMLVSTPSKEEIAEIIAETGELEGVVVERLAMGRSRAFIAALMLDDESRSEFSDLRLPTRGVIQLQRWLLETYGLRPTGSSTGSSEPSSVDEPSEPSTAPTSDEASTS